MELTKEAAEASVLGRNLQGNRRNGKSAHVYGSQAGTGPGSHREKHMPTEVYRYIIIKTVSLHASAKTQCPGTPLPRAVLAWNLACGAVGAQHMSCPWRPSADITYVSAGYSTGGLLPWAAGFRNAWAEMQPAGSIDATYPATEVSPTPQVAKPAPVFLYPIFLPRLSRCQFLDSC